jgi:hypothetical protein
MIEPNNPSASSEQSTAEKAIDGIQSTAAMINEAIETAQRPGMPLDRLAAQVRETPLALAIAFLLGVIVIRRR